MMRNKLSKRRRAAVIFASTAAMSGTTPVLARGHHVLMAFIIAFEVVMLVLGLRLLYESNHEGCSRQTDGEDVA